MSAVHVGSSSATAVRVLITAWRVAFFVESTCDLHWITGIDQPADACDDRTVDFVGAIPRRVLDHVTKLHDDQWVVHANLSLSSFSGFNKKTTRWWQPPFLIFSHIHLSYYFVKLLCELDADRVNPLKEYA